MNENELCLIIDVFDPEFLHYGLVIGDVYPNVERCFYHRDILTVRFCHHCSYCPLKNMNPDTNSNYANTIFKCSIFVIFNSFN